MTTPNSVTGWIAELKAGEQTAAEQLWERYFHRIVGLARNKLAASSRRMADEEDLALSAFKSFCLGAVDGRFPQLSDRDNLWPLLVAITTHKALDQIKSERRQKRGGSSSRSTFSQEQLEKLLSREPTPEFAAQMAEACDALLKQLPEILRPIAEQKLIGHTNPEIAQRLGCGLRTVERRLELIRRHWEAAEAE